MAGVWGIIDCALDRGIAGCQFSDGAGERLDVDAPSNAAPIPFTNRMSDRGILATSWSLGLVWLLFPLYIESFLDTAGLPICLVPFMLDGEDDAGEGTAPVLRRLLGWICGGGLSAERLLPGRSVVSSRPLMSPVSIAYSKSTRQS